MLAACAVWHEGTRVDKWPGAPVTRVSFEIDASKTVPQLQEEPIEPESLEHLQMALSSALARHGVSVVAKGEGGAPALIGDVEMYYEGDDNLAPYGRGEYRIAWRLVDGNGAILGRCVTDADSGLLWGRVSYEALLDATGGELAVFLLKRKA